MAEVLMCDVCREVKPKDKFRKAYTFTVGGEWYLPNYMLVKFFDRTEDDKIDVCSECTVKILIEVAKRMVQQQKEAKEKGHSFTI